MSVNRIELRNTWEKTRFWEKVVMLVAVVVVVVVVVMHWRSILHPLCGLGVRLDDVGCLFLFE